MPSAERKTKMCRDITFAAAVNSLVSVLFLLSGRRNYSRKCVSGSLFFSCLLFLLPHLVALGIAQSLISFFSFYQRFLKQFSLFFFLVTNGVMHFFRRRGYAHVRLQTDSYAYSNLGPYPNSEPIGSFHQ